MPYTPGAVPSWLDMPVTSSESQSKDPSCFVTGSAMDVRAGN